MLKVMVLDISSDLKSFEYFLLYYQELRTQQRWVWKESGNI